MPKFNTNQLHNILQATHNDLKTKAQTLSADTHLTAEGKAAQWARLTNKHHSELQDVITIIEDMGTNITRQVDDLERDYYDTTRIPKSELLAAELGAARIMGRGNLDHEAVNNHLKNMSTATITGADVIVINEAIARGVITHDNLKDMLKAHSQLYRETTREAEKVQTAINTVMKPLAQDCVMMLTDHTALPDINVHGMVAIESITGPEGIDVEM